MEILFAIFISVLINTIILEAFYTRKKQNINWRKFATREELQKVFKEIGLIVHFYDTIDPSIYGSIKSDQTKVGWQEFNKLMTALGYKYEYQPEASKIIKIKK